MRYLVAAMRFLLAGLDGHGVLVDGTAIDGTVCYTLAVRDELLPMGAWRGRN